MPEIFMTTKRWPLILVTVILSMAFAWVFIAIVERAKLARSAELSLEHGNSSVENSKGLTLTPALNTLPERTPLPRRPMQPAPWWPAVLFGLAFLSGWAFRQALGKPSNTLDSSDSEDLSATVSGDVTADSVDHGDLVITNPQTHDTTHLTPTHPEKNRKVAATTPDLNTDFPWDESALNDLVGLSGAERIARLEEQNTSKAEIIKALERLVVENREKWLHQDETEARLDQHIQALTDDLQVAVRQLQQLQAKAPDALVGKQRNNTQ